MRILLVITSLGVGGAERLVTALADQYVLAGHQVVLARLHGEARLKPSDQRVRLENLAMHRSFLGVLSGVVRFRKLIKEFRPDVVNSHLVHANILARLLRLFVTMPRLISSAHNVNEGGAQRMFAYKITDKLADLSTNVSQEAVSAFEKKGALKRGRMLAIHNGINTEDFVFDAPGRAKVRAELSVEQNDKILLAVGSLSPQKDYFNLLRAFARLPKSSCTPYLVIVGEGSLRAELDALAVSLDIKDRVFFLGVRHDIPALMSGCDVFVLSSAWEGFGLVVAEAMACERTVVATDSGGVREVVGDKGFLVPPHDHRALSRQLEEALNLSEKDLKHLGRSARMRVIDKFSLGATADRYLKLYQAKDQSGLDL
jgi:glycosyltransferase involved in cell wall biosynthesis